MDVSELDLSVLCSSKPVICASFSHVTCFVDYEPPVRGSGGSDGHGILGNAINVMPVPDNRHRTMMIDSEDEDEESVEHDIDNRPPLVNILINFCVLCSCEKACKIMGHLCIQCSWLVENSSQLSPVSCKE